MFGVSAVFSVRAQLPGTRQATRHGHSGPQFQRCAACACCAGSNSFLGAVATVPFSYLATPLPALHLFTSVPLAVFRF
jgi:hypothetical protein